MDDAFASSKRISSGIAKRGGLLLFLMMGFISADRPALAGGTASSHGEEAAASMVEGLLSGCGMGGVEGDSCSSW